MTDRWLEHFTTVCVWMMVACIALDLTLYLNGHHPRNLTWFVVHSTILAALLWGRDQRRRSQVRLAEVRRQIKAEREAFERMVEEELEFQRLVVESMRREGR